MELTELKWSYSGLKQFLTCPKQYYELKVAKNYTPQDTVQTLYGKEVHKAFEEHVVKGTPLPRNYHQYKPIMDVLLEIPGKRYTEYEMAMDKFMRPVGFHDKDYWVRGIADLMIIAGNEAYIIDYKTGNPRYADTKQLKLMALMAHAHFPQIDYVRAGLIFTSKFKFFPEEYDMKDYSALWEEFRPDLMRLTDSYTNDKWPTNPSGLCRKHCPVTTCTFHGGS